MYQSIETHSHTCESGKKHTCQQPLAHSCWYCIVGGLLTVQCRLERDREREGGGGGGGVVDRERTKEKGKNAQVHKVISSPGIK